MDVDGQQSRAVFDALIAAVDRLDQISYALYVKHSAPGRGLGRSIATAGPSFKIHRSDGTVEVFDGAFILGCYVHQDEAADSVIIFTVVLCWTRQEWVVRAWVEEEDS